MNSQIQKRLFEDLPNIKELSLFGFLGDFSLDNLHNLKTLVIGGCLDDSFNFSLFENICDRLEKLHLKMAFNDESLFVLINGHTFSNLKSFTIEECQIKSIEKKLFVGFPMLQKLKIFNNEKLKEVDHGVFSELKHLERLSVFSNGIRKSYRNYFPGLYF